MIHCVPASIRCFNSIEFLYYLSFQFRSGGVLSKTTRGEDGVVKHIWARTKVGKCDIRLLLISPYHSICVAFCFELVIVSKVPLISKRLVSCCSGGCPMNFAF